MTEGVVGPFGDSLTGGPAIVFGFGDLNEHAIRSGIPRIADLLASSSGHAADAL